MRLLITALLLLILSLTAFGQEESENPEPAKLAETVKIDEFGRVGDCELGARIDTLFIALGDRPDSTAYIIVYRGAEALPSEQTESYSQRQLSLFRNHISFRKYEANRVVLIDGGFRQGDSVWREFWLVPEGGIIPEPTGTVEKPKMPTDKAFKVDERYLEISDAAIQKEEEIYEDSEQMTDEISETTEETVEAETSETVTPVEEEVLEEYPEYDSMSDFFAETLKQNPKAGGMVIFYFDEEEFDVAKSRQIVEEGLRRLSEKSEINLSKVKIIFGGYRNEQKIEFWIVPKGAKEPSATPEQRPLPEEKNEEK